MREHTPMPTTRRVLRLPERARQRLSDWLRGSPTGLVVVALTIGAGDSYDGTTPI